MKHLSRFDIEAIAVKYVQAYMALPDVRNTQIYRIDPELLLEKVLGLNVEYQHLSYDGSILGMTSFTEMGVQVFEDDDNEAFFFLDGKTVLVEKIECLNKIYFPGVYKRFDALADFLGCSKKALAIRMKQLGLLKKEYLDNPFDLVTVYPEVSEL